MGDQVDFGEICEKHKRAKEWVMDMNGKERWICPTCDPRLGQGGSCYLVPPEALRAFFPKKD